MATANNTTELGAQWAAVQTGGACFLWAFSQSLVGFVEANPKLKLAEIGVELAKAAKRSTPYSKPWVSRAIKAGRTITEEPTTEEQATAFCDLFYGNVKRTGAKTAKKPTSSDDALKAAIAFAKRAVKLGMDAADVQSEIADALDGDTEDASVSAAA